MHEKIKKSIEFILLLKLPKEGLSVLRILRDIKALKMYGRNLEVKVSVKYLGAC